MTHDSILHGIQCIRSPCTDAYAGVDEDPLLDPETVVPRQIHLSYALRRHGGKIIPQYWCSERCNEQKVTDVLSFELVHPVCLVKEVQIEPYIGYPEASISHACKA